MIGALADGSVKLYHNNAKKLETTSTGVDVTGIAVTDGITSSGNITFDNGNSSVSIKSDGANGSYIQFGSNEYLRFLYDNGASESIRLIDGGGITFNGDTAAANALDDYEEGTWSPVWDPTTSGSITTNTSYTGGIYTKVGNLVTVSWRLYTNSVNSPAGKITINGLPFTIRSGGYSTPKILFPILGLSSNLAGSPIGTLNANTTTVTVADFVWGVTESGADIAQKFDNDVWSYGTFSYFT